MSMKLWERRSSKGPTLHLPYTCLGIEWLTASGKGRGSTMVLKFSCLDKAGPNPTPVWELNG